MVERHVLKVGAIAWGAVGMVVAVASLGRVNADARVWIWVVSIAFPLCAVLASLALDHGRDRVAGALLLASAATPTYFAWILNVPPLVVGVALLVAPTLTVNRRPVAIGSGVSAGGHPQVRWGEVSLRASPPVRAPAGGGGSGVAADKRPKRRWLRGSTLRALIAKATDRQEGGGHGSR